jgi:prevent-host-death family protein
MDFSADFAYHTDNTYLEGGLVDLPTVSAGDFQRHFGRYQDEALKQPLVITNNGRERLVVLAVEEYQRLNRRDRTVRKVADMSAADLEAVANTEMDPRHTHLNAELD